MEFVLPLVSPRLMAIVVLHGVLDLAHPVSLLAYAGALLPNRPPPTVLDTLAFAVASVLHFGSDSNMTESVALHGLIVATYAVAGGWWAVAFLFLNFFLVHLPRLWLRAFEETRQLEILLLIAGLAVALAFPKRVCRTALRADDEEGTFRFSFELQRLVTCHVLAEHIRFRR